MNLVAKEFIAAQDPENPGVLVLSCFAGAAQQMKAALLVNPYDTLEMAEALYRALTMSLTERCQRFDELIRGLQENDIHQWRNSFVSELTHAGLESDVSKPESHGFRRLSAK
jgi:trehalose 6-phosphate synthase